MDENKLEDEIIVNKSLKDMILNSLINTQQMFLHNQNKKIVEQDKLNYKLKLKANENKLKRNRKLKLKRNLPL